MVYNHAMKRTTTLKFEGGPLAGVEMTKTRPARLSTYLADDGVTTVRSDVGDRARLGRSSVAGLYALAGRSATSLYDRVITYRFVD
jgi:hypothetical protein